MPWILLAHYSFTNMFYSACQGPIKSPVGILVRMALNLEILGDSIGIFLILGFHI